MIAFFMCICIIIGFNMLREQEDQLGGQGTDGPIPTQEKEGPPPEEKKPGEAALLRELDRALSKVEENPEDPFARLELALIYLQLGDPEAAKAEYDEGGDLAGTDPTYFVQAGDRLNELGFWVESLEAYATAIDLGIDFNDPDFQRNFRETMYFVSIVPEIEPHLFPEDFGEDSPQSNYPPFYVARARYTLYHGGAEDALEIIKEVQERFPEFNLPEADLVEAEALITLGRVDQAKDILRNLTSNPAPQWVKEEARRLLGEIRE